MSVAPESVDRMKVTGRALSRRTQALRRLESEGAEQPWKEPGLSRAERVLTFLRFLPVTKGKRAGKLMELLPSQVDFVNALYGGKRRVRLGILSEPRGNGKTGLLAGLCLAHLLGPESEQRGEIYSAAIDRQQAGIMYNEVEAIILAVPQFSFRCNLQRFHKKIEVWEGDGEGSLFESLSSDARRAHGLAPSLWVYDELAQAKDRELLDNLQTAMGKRVRSLGIVISTQAPTDDHPLSQLIDDARNSGDPSIVVKVIAASEDEDPFSPKTIRKCNPALGKFLDESDLLAEAERARRSPAFEPAFRNLRLNQRVDARADVRIVTKGIWARGAIPVDREKLKGRECYGGLDLSGKHDLCSFELVFPDDEAFDILSFFWTPKEQLEGRRPAERDLFKLWIKEGHLIAVPGPTIRFGWVAGEIAKLSAEFDIRCIGYDRWRIDDFKQDMDDVGCSVPLEPFGQGFRDMAPAVEFFSEKALTGNLRHGGHPILTACVFTAILVSDPAGNKKFDKERSNKGATVRIDGATALTMALGTAKRFVQERAPDYQMIFV